MSSNSLPHLHERCGDNEDQQEHTPSRPGNAMRGATNHNMVYLHVLLQLCLPHRPAAHPAVAVHLGIAGKVANWTMPARHVGTTSRTTHHTHTSVFLSLSRSSLSCRSDTANSASRIEENASHSSALAQGDGYAGVNGGGEWPKRGGEWGEVELNTAHAK